MTDQEFPDVVVTDQEFPDVIPADESDRIFFETVEKIKSSYFSATSSAFKIVCFHPSVREDSREIYPE